MAKDNIWSNEHDNEKFGSYGFTRGDFKKNSWMFGIKDVRQATTSELMSIDWLMEMRDGNIKEVNGKKLHYPVDHSGMLSYVHFNQVFMAFYYGLDFYYKGEEYKVIENEDDKWELVREKDQKVLVKNAKSCQDILLQSFDGDKSIWDVITECGFVLKEPDENYRRFFIPNN